MEFSECLDKCLAQDHQACIRQEQVPVTVQQSQIRSDSEKLLIIASNIHVLL
jgi:hypothetical protein